LRHRLEQPRGLVAERAPRLGGVDVEPAHVLDVGARGERAVAGAGEDDDADELRKRGVAGIFTPGAPTSEIVDFLKGAVPVA